MNVDTKELDQPGVPQGLALILGCSLSVMSFIILAPVLPQLMIVFHDVPNAKFWVPAMVSIPGLGAAAFSPFAGFIGDRFGRRVPLIIFCIAYFIIGVLPLVLNDFTAIFITRVGVGIAHMGILVISTAMIGDYFSGARRDRWLASQAMVGTLSSLVLLPLGGLLGAWLGWRGPFLIFLSGVPLAIAYWVLCPEPKLMSEASGSRVPWSALPWRWLSGISLISAFFALLFNAVQLQLGLALAAVGITDAARIGFLSSIAIAGIPAGALLFVKVAAHPFMRLLCAEFLIAGVTLMMMRFCEDYRVLLAVAFVNLMSCGMLLPTLGTHVTRNLDSTVRARGIGVWQTAFSIGLFLSVGASGLIMQLAGGTILDAYWVLGMSAVAVSAMAFVIIVIRRNSLATSAH